jgi:hypothetical protein
VVLTTHVMKIFVHVYGGKSENVKQVQKWGVKAQIDKVCLGGQPQFNLQLQLGSVFPTELICVICRPL